MDDAKGFFNLIPISPSDYWKMGNIVLDDYSPSALQFLTTNRVSFGHSLSPSVAQRLADPMVEEWYERMDQIENEILRSIYDHEVLLPSTSGAPQQGACYSATAACDWLRARTLLSQSTGRPQRRLFVGLQYTDDFIVLANSPERLGRALECC